MQRLDIGVAGAGIGGLAVAALLARTGHRVQIFDQFDAPAPVGSGLVIQPVGLDVLDRIGAGDVVRRRGAPITRMLGHETSGGRRVLDVSYPIAGDGVRGIGIHRSALFEALLEKAQDSGATLRTGHRVLGRSESRLEFDGGRTDGPFDLIIDATGTGSPLSPIRSRPLSYGALWGTVDWPSDTGLSKDHLTQRYYRASRMAGVLPVGKFGAEPGQKAAIFWSLPVTGHQAWQEGGISAWHEAAIAFWPEFAPFTSQIREQNHMTMARYGHGTLAQPWRPGIAFIGNAAHRASPQLGQGANMALLDAAALATALDVAGPEDALPLYARARRWHVRVYQAMSWAFTPQYQSDSRVLPALRDRVLFPLSRIPPIPRILTHLVRGDMLPPLGRLQRR